MRILLHMGQDKTGTTALQRALAQSRGMLLAHRVLYPGSPNDIANHEPLAYLADWLLKPPGSDSNRRLIRRHARGTVVEIQQRVESIRPHLTIISSEALYCLRPRAMAKLAMLMRQLSDDIIPILYVREPAGRYLASIQQNFRTHSTAPAPGPIELRRVVENIRQHFGDQLVVRPFEPAQLFNCDIVTDFTQHFLEAYIPTGLVNPTRENESMSAEAMAISSAYRAITRSRQEGQIDSEAIQFLQTVLETDYQLKGYSKPKLVPEVANYVRSASIDYKWLAETYGITFAPLRSDIDSVATNQAPNIEKLSDAVHVSWTRYDGLLETIADRLGAKAPPSSVLKEMASTHQATRPCFINREQFRLQKLPRPTRQLLQLARSITRRSEKRYH